MNKLAKALVIFVLLLIILTTSVFIYIKLSSQGDENNYFNQNWRSELAKHPTLRNIFYLHNDGDGRYDYLNPEVKELEIYIYEMQNERVDLEVLDQVVSRISEVSGKSVKYNFTNNLIPYSPTITEEEREAIIEDGIKKWASNNTINLFVFSQDSEEPGLLGLTYHENSIMIFNDALKAFTAQTPRTYQSYQLSTILHEIGHQFGLPHNTLAGCIMGEHAEELGVPKYDRDQVVTNFCEKEKEDIYSFQK
jgi:predicted Zn-dependent protease